MKYFVLSFFNLLAIFISAAASTSGGTTTHTSDEKHYNFSVAVYDQTSCVPLELVRISLESGGQIIRVEPTNPTGKATFRDVEAGQYIMGARRLGYTEYVDTILIDETHTTATIRITETVLLQQTVE